MAPPSETARADAAFDLLLSAVPVSDANLLLTSLAQSWSVACNSSTLFVSFVSSGQACGAMLCGGKVELVCRAEADSWSAPLATAWLTEQLVESPGLLNSLLVIPFEQQTSGELSGAVGGVLSLDGQADLKSVRRLTELSARLIIQWDLMSECVGSENSLRDLKLEAMAEFAAGAGHEINNPIATIAGRASLLLKKESDPERRRALETIGAQAYRVRDMIGDAMTFARPPEPISQEIRADELVRDVLRSVEESIVAQRAVVATELDELTIEADSEQFRVVVSCLLRNSLEAIGEDGEIEVHLKQAEGACVRLLVCDSGKGLDDVECEHLFDPFFSGRQAGRGLGFGLSKCWQILRMHGGSIDVVERTDGRFAIESVWPVSQSAKV